MSGDSFAAAQKRILERQIARQAALENTRTNEQSLIHESTISKLPYPLNRTAGPLSSFWSTILRSEGTRPAFRVGQVDAELLDEELLGLLRRQIGEGLKYFGGHLQDDWSSEITLTLRAILFKLSIWDHDASYGAALQNLRFTDARISGSDLPRPSRLQKSLYGLITVLGRYGWDKWENWIVEQDGGYETPSQLVQRLSKITDRITSIHSIAAFVSFIVFLINGRYRTLTDRILRLRLISPISQISREVSFEYLNRQLVWHAFTEFLLFLLPLVGISRWRRWLSRVWRRTKMALRNDDENQNEILKKGPLAILPERTCAICHQDQNPTTTSEAEILGANTSAGGGLIGSATTDIVNPYETIPCGCVYCFVCLTSKIEAEEGNGWSCLRCGEIIYKCKPWSGDVIVERVHKSNGKSVGFAVEDKPEPKENEDTESQSDGTEKIHSDLGSSHWNLEGQDREEKSV